MDLRQFNCPDQERPSWFERGERAVSMLEPIASSLRRELVVADVGCGDMKVRESLQRGGFPFVYRGYDLVPQSPEVVPLDVSRQAPPSGADVVMMLGVGEYIENLSVALERLATAAPYLVLSHVVREYSAYTPERLRELGWVNHLTESEFAALLEGAGWRIDQRQLTANRRTVLWLAHSAHVRPA